jgi:hypothetical protein
MAQAEMLLRRGEVAERLMVLLSKSSVPPGTEGSNPSLSANRLALLVISLCIIGKAQGILIIPFATSLAQDDLSFSYYI